MKTKGAAIRWAAASGANAAEDGLASILPRLSARFFGAQYRTDVVHACQSSTLGEVAIMMFRFRRSYRRRLTFLAFLFSIFFMPAGVSAGSALTASIQKTALMPNPQPYLPVYDLHKRTPVDGVCLFTLHDKACKPQFYDRNELVKGRPLKIRGYVVGIVVFGADDLKVQLGKQQFCPIQSSTDGTFMVKGYGKVDPADLAARDHAPRPGGALQAPAADPPSTRPIPSAYYYFPKVYGEAVSPQPKFELQLAGGAGRRIVEIEHQPIQRVDLSGAVRSHPATTFSYVGDRLNVLLSQQSDFRARLAAIAEGIKQVEDTFRVDLVQNVQLIDMNGKNNALTYDGLSTVWFYIDTVMGTSIKELRRMGSHEALHQLVYRTRLAYRSPIRRFFADLWGLDDFSVARFQVVTTGWFDSQSAYLPPSGGLFFSFINEKNFLNGMHGGHSQDNIDEFLVSFIHSLLHIDRLGHNLRFPVKLVGADTPYRLKEDDRNKLLRLYKQSINLLMQTVGASSGQPDSEPSSLYRFLNNRLATVDKIHLTAVK
jgi:hypothetical protein